MNALEQKLIQHEPKPATTMQSQSYMHQQHDDLWAKLDHFEAPYLQEKLLQKGVFQDQEDYRSHFEEFKKYVFLAATNPTPLAMLSEKVDEVWHQFILFTRQYHTFCADFLGGYFHHTPKTSFTPMDDKKSTSAFMQAYQDVFGKIHPTWKVKTASCSSCCGSGCASCGSGGSLSS